MPDGPRTEPETTDRTSTFAGATPLEASSVSAAAGATRGVQFTILRRHARGGLGQVSVARDHRLRREVALKEIRPDVDHPVARQRFLNEAEITGRLEHPGVVPIYALDVDDEGRPFYAMRFVQGRTLADAIRHYHASPTPLGFADLLRRLASVCQTIAYAHSKGILHRDLKPANIMLGDYGETLVLDWGLAKEVPSPESSLPGEQAPLDALPRVFDSREKSVSGLTQAGQALGTPAYMAPEQATGGRVGPAADVFALGAILFEILTSRPPYQGSSVPAVLALAQRGAPPEPGHLRRGVPRALNAVCRKALARDPDARYGSAAEVGADIDRWLADEPVSAEQEPLTQRAWRVVKRHRVKVAVLLAGLLAALPLSIALYLNAEWALETTRKAEQEARANLRIASTLNNFMNEDLFDSPLIRHRCREATLFEIVEAVAPTIDKRFADHPDCRAHVQHSIGSIYDQLGEHERAVPYLEAALAYHEQSDGPDAGSTRTARSALAGALMPVGRLEEAEALYRTNLAAELANPSAPEEHADSLLALGECLTGQDRLHEADKYVQQGLELCRQHLGPEHRLTLSGLGCLSKVRYLQGDLRTAEKLDQQVLAGRLKLYPADHFEVLEARNNLATTQLRLGLHIEAAQVLREVLATCRRVKGPNHPHTVLTLGNLALAVSKSDKPEEAEPLFQEAIARVRETQPDELPALAANLAHYGSLLMTLKRYPEAEPHLREAFTIRRGCLPAGHWLLGQVEARLGSCLSLQGRFAEAEPLLLAGQAILAAADHAPPLARTTAIEQLVKHYEALGKSDEAARWRARLPEKE